MENIARKVSKLHIKRKVLKTIIIYINKYPILKNTVTNNIYRGAEPRQKELDNTKTAWWSPPPTLFCWQQKLEKLFLGKKGT